MHPGLVAWCTMGETKSGCTGGGICELLHIPCHQLHLCAAAHCHQLHHHVPARHHLPRCPRSAACGAYSNRKLGQGHTTVEPTHCLYLCAPKLWVAMKAPVQLGATIRKLGQPLLLRGDISPQVRWCRPKGSTRQVREISSTSYNCCKLQIGINRKPGQGHRVATPSSGMRERPPSEWVES